MARGQYPLRCCSPWRTCIQLILGDARCGALQATPEHCVAQNTYTKHQRGCGQEYRRPTHGRYLTDDRGGLTQHGGLFVQGTGASGSSLNEIGTGDPRGDALPFFGLGMKQDEAVLVLPKEL